MEETLGLVKRWASQARALPMSPGGPVTWVQTSDTVALIDAILTSSNSAHEATRRYYEAFWSGATPESRRLHGRAVNWLLADLDRRGTSLSALPGVGESPLFEGMDVPSHSGRRLTADLLVLLNFAILAHQQLQPAAPGQIVLEVGGCYGELARLLRLVRRDHPPATHVMVDIPEGLALSYLFLSQSFPGEPMVLVASAAELRQLELGRYRFVFVPAALAQELAGRSIDLVVSTTNLGGARSTGLTGWTALVQQTLRPAKLVALDRFLNTHRPGLAPWRPPEAEGAMGYDSRWQILNWEIEPSYLRCPFATSLYPRCVQIVAQRTGEPNAAQARAASQQLLADVEDSLWCRHFDGGALEGTCWDNVMVNDGGMGGMTFKLWESVRLSPRPENLRLMIQHIDHVQRFEGKGIEETAVYEERLSLAVAACDDKARQDEFSMWMCDRLRDRPDPAAMTNYLRVMLPQCKGKRIVCYGVGRDFEAMVAAGLFAGSEVVGIIDDKRSPGSEVAGFKVHATAELTELRPDVILATSSRFGAALRERAAGIVTALGLKAIVR